LEESHKGVAQMIDSRWYNFINFEEALPGEKTTNVSCPIIDPTTIPPQEPSITVTLLSTTAIVMDSTSITTEDRSSSTLPLPPSSPTHSASSSSPSSSSSALVDDANPEPVHHEDDTTIVDLCPVIGKPFPETQEEADIVDDFLLQEFNSMSFVERDMAIFDVHGLPQVGDEDPNNVSDYLLQLDWEVTQIRDKTAYEEAKYLNANFVTSRRFRLMFLRCERFNVQRAAQKMVDHFAVKREIFGGGEILGRDIKLSDLSKKEMEYMKWGGVQLMPSRDAGGRAVIICSQQDDDWECRVKQMWYILQNASMDEQTQKRGIVFVVWGFRSMMKDDTEEIFRSVRVRDSVPFRTACVHLCYDDESLRPYVTGSPFYHLKNKAQRARYRKHLVRKPADIVFQLQTFGIPITPDHVAPDGSVTLEWHHEWLTIRSGLEETSEKLDNESDIITVPRRFDVLFGRGKNTREHTGNLRCAHLVEMNRPMYEKANKYQKTEIAERIVSIIHESYGRFLKWDDKVRVHNFISCCCHKSNAYFVHGTIQCSDVLFASSILLLSYFFL
jgi:hypothetical protein